VQGGEYLSSARGGHVRRRAGQARLYFLASEGTKFLE